MNPRAEYERLLDDVLGGDDAGFRDALFVETLRLARHRRRVRQLQRAVPGLAILIALAVLWWQSLPPPALPKTGVRPYEIVSTLPLPASALVTTHPLPLNRLVVSTSHTAIVYTATDESPLREIDDGELLTFVGSKPVALVRYGQHSAELLFIQTADEAKLFGN